MSATKRTLTDPSQPPPPPPSQLKSESDTGPGTPPAVGASTPPQAELCTPPEGEAGPPLNTALDTPPNTALDTPPKAPLDTPPSTALDTPPSTTPNTALDAPPKAHLNAPPIAEPRTATHLGSDAPPRSDMSPETGSAMPYEAVASPPYETQAGAASGDRAVESPGGEGWARGLAYLGVVAMAAGLSALAAALYFGGALHSTAPWLDGSGGLTRGGLPIAELVMNVAGTVTVGLLLASALLLPDSRGDLPPLACQVLRGVRSSAALWAVATLVTVLLSVSYLLGKPVSAVSDDDLLSFITDLTQGRAQIAVGTGAILLTITATRPRTAGGVAVLLVLALATLLPPALTGHSATSHSHSMAVFSLAVHIVAANLWVGGLVALIALAGPARRLLPAIVPRYSTLAGICLAAVATSGVINAWLRLGGLDAIFGSRYGLLVVAKAMALGSLATVGWWHRRRSIPALTRRGNSAGLFVRLAAVEIVIMAAAFGLATGLSRTAPPAEETGPTSPAGILLGFEPPGPPDLRAYVLGWWNDPLFLSLVTAGAFFYLAGVVRLRRAGVHWPLVRTLAWLSGLVIVLAATCGGLARYSMVLFSAHLVQHLALTLLAPVPLLLGAPITLALRSLRREPAASGRTIREVLTALLGSRPVGLLAHPLAALALLIISLYGFYASPLFEASLRNHVLHSLTLVGFLAAGLFYLRLIIGAQPHAGRARLLLLSVLPFHLVFGAAFAKASGVVATDWYTALGRPWGTSPLHDQQTAGLIVLSFATLTTLATLPLIAGHREAPTDAPHTQSP